MLGYVTFIAILNLGLGYALAIYLRGRSGRSFRQFLAELSSTTPAENFAPRPAAVVAPSPIAAEAAEKTKKPLDDDDLIGAKAADELVAEAPISPKPAREPAGGLVTRDYVDQLLAELTAVSDPLKNPASVVLVELDSNDEAKDKAVSEGRLLTGVVNTVRELLAEAHTAARFSDHQLMLLLPGDDESVATQRTERLRQRIEATEFMVDETPVQATVSCALAQLSTDYAVADILASLQETLDEAKRLGGNRTFMYDGMTPAPVVPPELNLAMQKCAI